jgi:hypothetical protein
VDSVKTASTALSTGLAALLVAGTAISAQALSYTNAGGDIIDGEPTEFTFDVTSAPTTPFDVSLDISSLTHPNLFELQLYLKSPTGKILTLAENLTGSNLVGTGLSDSGTQPIDTASAPYTGIFTPEGTPGTMNFPATVVNFTGFNKTDPNPNGIWTLIVFDVTPEPTASNGVLGLTTLNINAAPTAVPFDFNSNTALLLLGGFWGAQKWWQSRRKNPSDLN